MQVRGALDVHRELLARDVAHEVVRLSGLVTTADELPRALGVEATSCLAVRCYSTDLGFVAVLVHAGVVPEPSAVLIALGAHTLRPATADEVNAATDYAAGLVSPLCLPSEVTLPEGERWQPDSMPAPGPLPVTGLGMSRDPGHTGRPGFHTTVEVRREWYF